MTILASLWFRVGYQAKRYTPWIRLALWRTESLGSPVDRARRSASRTLLIDYPNMPAWDAIRKAVVFRDYLVVSAIVVSFVIYIQITISTGLINSEPRRFDHDISVLVEDRLTAVGRDDIRASLPMVAINGMVALNMTIPNGHTRTHAFQWFSPHQDAGTTSTSFEATVGVASVDVQCEAATLEDPTNTLAPDSLLLRFNSSYCTSRQLIVQVQAQNAAPVPEGRSYFWVYDERGACENSRKGIVLAAVVAVDREGDNLSYVSSSRIMCSVGLVFGNATVRIADGRQPEISSVTMGPRDANPDILTELQTHRLDNVRSGSDLQENTGPDYASELQLSPFRVGASLLSGGVPDIASLLRHETLQDVITAWMQHFGALLLHYNHRVPDQQVTEGKASVTRSRLVVNGNIAHGMAGGFALMALMTLWMVYYAPPRSGFVPRDPDTISGCAVLLSKSSELLTTLHGTGHETLKDATQQISGTYRTVIQSSPDNALSPSFHLRRDGPEAPVSPRPQSSQGTQQNGELFRPWSPRGLRTPVRWAGLAAMIGIGATAVGLLVRSNRDNGFFDTGDDPNIQYLWTILPTLVMEALTIYVKGSDFSIRVLAPFTALQSRRDTFERALSMSYTNELGPATIYRAVRQGSWAVVVSKTMAITCTLLPIITNALFSVENLQVEVRVQLQQQTWFGSGDYKTASWQAPSQVADMLLRDDVNSTFPPWSYDEWAFHVQKPVGDTVQSADATDLSLRARLAAVSVDLDCELTVKPGPVPARNGVPVEIQGRNVTCFGGFDCRKHSYFGGSMGGHYLSAACGVDLPPTNYVWGRCDENGGDALDFIALLVCNETAVEQYFDATLSGPDLKLDTSLEPPVPLPGTARPYAFHGRINDIYTGLFPGDENFDQSAIPGPYLDRFFRSLVTRKPALPLSHLDSPSAVNTDNVAAAIKKQHGIIRAQTLNYDGRSQMAATRALRLPFSTDENNATAQYPPFTESQPPAQPATLRHSPSRLVQSPTATYIILGVLSLVFILNLVSILITNKVQMPKSPGGVAAMASLLADSTIFKHLPAQGVEWMRDEELAEHFRGRGVTFRMGWFGAGGSRYYTIGVVEDELLALDHVEVQAQPRTQAQSSSRSCGGGSNEDGDGPVGRAAPMAS